MGGILLDQALPVAGVDQVDPFLLIHHWAHNYPGGQKQQHIGVGPHPHRGFSPVTLIFKGAVHHRDSQGNDSIIEAGGTQWMNSGRGIIHSERAKKEIAESGGEFEIIQFWVNAPAYHKMDEPSYQPLKADEMPVLMFEDGKARVGLVAGELYGHQGKVQPYSDLLVLRLDFEPGGKVSIPLPQNFNALVYQLDGALTINNTPTKAKDLTLFNNDGDTIELEAREHTRAILLAGEPLREQVMSYGPFVMNTRSQILEAVQEFNEGKMGELVEQFN